MNKFFTKVATLSIGLTMAIGVGVAVGSNSRKATEVEAAAANIVATFANFGLSGSNGSATETTTGYQLYITSGNSNSGVGKNEKIYNKVALPGGITNVTVNGAATASSKTDGSFSVYGGSSSGSETVLMGSATGLSDTASNQSIDFSGAYNYFTITVGAARTLKFTNITVTYSTGTTYTVGGTISYGHLSSTSLIESGKPLNISLVPDTHYHLPTSLTLVSMGGTELVAGTGYTYDNSTGAIGIASVNGNIIINASCVENDKVLVKYVAGANGSGSDYSKQEYLGSYVFADYADLKEAGHSANLGYIFKCYTIGDDEYDPGDEYNITAAVTITVTYELLPTSFVVDQTSLSKTTTSAGYAGWNGTRSVSGYDITTNAVMVQSNKVQFQKSASAYMYNATPFDGIKLIRMTGGSGTIKVSFDDDTAGSGSSSIGSLITAVSVGSVIYYVPSISNAKYFHIVSANSDTAKFSTIEVYDYKNTAIAFAGDFTTAMATPCASPNANNKSAVSAIWETYKTGFEALTSDVKSEFGTSTDETVVQARTLYLHCVTRYSLSTWTGAPSSQAIRIAGISLYDSSASITIIVIIASIIGLTAIGGYFLFKKKKQY